MIDLKQVSKVYGEGSPVVALHPTSLQIQDGEIFGIIGESGAGKSTLLRLINGLEKPSTGDVWVNQQSIQTLSPQALRQARANMGMIFQHFYLVMSKTVFDNIALPLRLSKMPEATITTRVRALLDRVGLSKFAQSYPAQLSGGQKQRVAIARALAHQPNILLSDEATSSLDPETTENILALLKSLHDELGLTIVLITHEMEVIKSICTRVAVMSRGAVVEQGDVLDLFTAPRDPFTKKLVARSMGESLPPTLLARLSSVPTAANEQPLIHVAFRGKAATEPLIAGLVRECNASVNILQAHLETLQGEGCGTMMFTLAQADKCEAVLAYLIQHGARAEVMGYVSLNESNA
ncbi:MAG: methionine ABC transporter ATP-binding protein [Gammaproteobacteria bacterium]